LSSTEATWVFTVVSPTKSDWVPFEGVRAVVPWEPGVYLLRESGPGVIRYVGHAGERAGSGGRPQGLYGRLSVYWTGKGAVSGFGEAALDCAFADADWVEEQLAHLRAHGSKRAKDWARDAVFRLGLEVSWAVCADKADAVYLERQVENLLRGRGLWNR
jgi:hypothetical protein